MHTTSDNWDSGSTIRSILTPEVHDLVVRATPPTARVWRQTLTGILLGFGTIGVLEWFVLDGGLGSVGVHPHPYWLVILPMAAARGLTAGLLSAVAATALYGWGSLGAPGAAAGTSLLDVLTMREPLLFFSVAWVVGELRDAAQSRSRKLADAWRRAEVEVRRLTGERDALVAANRELEQRTVDPAGRLGDVVRAAARLEACDRAEVFDVALDLVEEHCGARASVYEVRADGSLQPAVQTGLSPAVSADRVAAVRASELVARTLEQGAPVDGFREGSPGRRGPLCVAPLVDGGGFVRAILCLDEVPPTRLGRRTAPLFFGIAEWVSACLTRLDRGRPLPSRRRAIELVAPERLHIGGPAELGERLRVEHERLARHRVPMCVIGIRARGDVASDVEARVGAVFGAGLRATDGLFRFGPPATWVLVLSATSPEAGEVPLRRLRERAVEAGLGAVEIFSCGPTDETASASAMLADLTQRVTPSLPHGAGTRETLDLAPRVGDRATFARRLDLEARLAVRLGTSLSLLELTVEVPEAEPADRLAQELTHASERALRRTDGSYLLGHNHAAILLPGAGPDQAALVARRLARFLEEHARGEAPRWGRVIAEVRPLDSIAPWSTEVPTGPVAVHHGGREAA